MLAGRLTGTLDGRPVVIDADGSGIVVSLAGFRSLWGMKRCAGSLVPLLRSLKYREIPVRIRIAGIVSVAVLPRPGALVRLFAPDLTHLA